MCVMHIHYAHLWILQFVVGESKPFKLAVKEEKSDEMLEDSVKYF